MKPYRALATMCCITAGVVVVVHYQQVYEREVCEHIGAEGTGISSHILFSSHISMGGIFSSTMPFSNISLPLSTPLYPKAMHVAVKKDIERFKRIEAEQKLKN
jgi:hypothetical protein